MPAQPDRAAGVLIEDGKVLLIARHKRDEDYFVVPGGKVEPGETPERACVRELKEEVNLDVRVGDLLGDFPDEGRTQHFFAVTRSGGDVRLGDGPEAGRVTPDNTYTPTWVSREELDDVEVRPRESARIIRRALKGSDRD